MTQYTPIPTSAAKFKNFAEMKHPNIIIQNGGCADIEGHSASTHTMPPFSPNG